MNIALALEELIISSFDGVDELKRIKDDKQNFGKNKVDFLIVGLK